MYALDMFIQPALADKCALALSTDNAPVHMFSPTLVLVHPQQATVSRLIKVTAVMSMCSLQAVQLPFSNQRYVFCHLSCYLLSSLVSMSSWETASRTTSDHLAKTQRLSSAGCKTCTNPVQIQNVYIIEWIQELQLLCLLAQGSQLHGLCIPVTKINRSTLLKVFKYSAKNALLPNPHYLVY